MNSLINLAHDCIILDACCALTLSASGQMDHILSATGKSVTIASYVLERELVNPGLLPVINALVTSGQLAVVAPANSNEEDAYVAFATMNLDNGEAVTGAIAMHRNWAVATDEKRALKVFARELPHLTCLTTPDLLFNWVELTKPPTSTIKSTLQTIQALARYKPSTDHRLHAWWLLQVS